MTENILATLSELREYALDKGYGADDSAVAIYYHEEDSYLMRFANSAISLNTNEHLVRLSITAYSGRKRANYELITDLTRVEEMRQGIDIAAEMVEHSQPLTYQPTVPVYEEPFVDESGYDAALANLGNSEKLAFFNSAVQGLETRDLKLAGVFSHGANTIALINTKS